MTSHCNFEHRVSVFDIRVHNLRNLQHNFCHWPKNKFRYRQGRKFCFIKITTFCFRGWVAVTWNLRWYQNSSLNNVRKNQSTPFLFWKLHLKICSMCEPSCSGHLLDIVLWWCHQMETFSALLALCEGNPTVTGGFLSERPVTRSFGVFFDLLLNKRLDKQSIRRWFETLSRSLWRHCNARIQAEALIFQKWIDLDTIN